MTKKHQALVLAEAGYPVFPLLGKTPVRGCHKCSRYLYDSGTRERNPDFSCKDGDKCPCVLGGNPMGSTCHGCWAGTTDLAVVEKWWTMNPDFNIGYHLVDWSHVIYDVDPRNGGSEALAELENTLGPVPASKVVETAGGGIHLYVDNPERLPVQRGWAAVGAFILNRKGSDRKTGIDIKAGPGFYVVAEGSEVGGNVYTVVNH